MPFVLTGAHHVFQWNRLFKRTYTHERIGAAQLLECLATDSLVGPVIVNPLQMLAKQTLVVLAVFGAWRKNSLAELRGWLERDGAGLNYPALAKDGDN
jgi:hypothetical protein